ncbi:unnamed protein product [Durusdinium trenchii]|uniref:Uncharacterized protein n=1 Tax=Durusdinium trenchii TaxID=1381693 RepID=A0ABP0PUA4_9DINO
MVCSPLTLPQLLFRLQLVGAPKVLMAMVLMLLWSSNVKTLTESYDFVELWAGRALTTTMIQKSGRAAAALDIEYFHPDPEHPHRSNHFDILTSSGFLLALATILNGKHGQFTVLCAIVCSSWTTINMGTSGRSVCTPLGCPERVYVQKANEMASRCFGKHAKFNFHVVQLFSDHYT